MKIARKWINDVVETLLSTEAHHATKYISDKLVVRATRRFYRVYRARGFERHKTELIITIGKPNFAGREFIKRCKNVGVPFPVKKIQLKFPPKFPPKRKR